MNCAENLESPNQCLVPEPHAHFSSILVKCFYLKYVLRIELLDDIKHAHNGWLQVRALPTAISYTHSLLVSRSDNCRRDHTGCFKTHLH
jgi:hypothetical protein